MSEPKLIIKEESSAKKTRSPPKKPKVEQSVPRKKKLKTDADKAAERAQHLRFGKAEITPDEASRMTKQQKRAMYAAAAARSAVHREIDQYEDDNVGTQALSEGEKAAGNVRDISCRYARKLKKKAKMQSKKGAKTAKSSLQKPTAAQDAGTSGTGEGGSNWLSRWRQKQDIQKSYHAATRSGGTAAQTTGGQKAASGGVPAAKSGMEQVIDKGRSVVSTAVNGIANFAKSNAHVLLIVGVFLLLILMVMSGFSSCGILFSGGTQVSGQTMYSAEDRDIRGAEQDYKKLEKELDKKIKRTPTDHPGYNEYQYHLDPIEHDPRPRRHGTAEGGSGKGQEGAFQCALCPAEPALYRGGQGRAAPLGYRVVPPAIRDDDRRSAVPHRDPGAERFAGCRHLCQPAGQGAAGGRQHPDARRGAAGERAAGQGAQPQPQPG